MASILHTRKRRATKHKKPGATQHKRVGMHGYKTPLPKGAKRDAWKHKDMMR